MSSKTTNFSQVHNRPAEFIKICSNLLVRFMANYHCMPTLIWVPFNRSPFWHSIKISAIAKTLKNRRYLFYANTRRIQLTTFWLIILLTVWGQNCSRWTACGLKGNQTSETAAVRNTSQMGIFSWSQNWLTKNLINRAQPATSRNLDSLKKVTMPRV